MHHFQFTCRLHRWLQNHAISLMDRLCSLKTQLIETYIYSLDSISFSLSRQRVFHVLPGRIKKDRSTIMAIGILVYAWNCEMAKGQAVNQDMKLIGQPCVATVIRAIHHHLEVASISVTTCESDNDDSTAQRLALT